MAFAEVSGTQTSTFPHTVRNPRLCPAIGDNPGRPLMLGWNRMWVHDKVYRPDKQGAATFRRPELSERGGSR